MLWSIFTITLKRSTNLQLFAIIYIFIFICMQPLPVKMKQLTCAFRSTWGWLAIILNISWCPTAAATMVAVLSILSLQLTSAPASSSTSVACFWLLKWKHMYVYVCMYNMHACMHIYMYMYVHVYVCIYLCMYACMCIYVLCMYACM